MATATPWLELLEGEELAYLGSEPARAGKAEPFPDDLDPRVASALVAQGITALWRHQAEAWEAARAGGHVIVTTGTASGKSLAFNLPVLDLLAREPKSRALYLYPTKALAQDQARALQAFGLKGLKPAIYDGDTESERRWQIRKWANVLLTNPDMLHVGVLPHHDRWGDVLANLRFVVVDEAHVYRGVFGSHVGNVLRRLRRLARAYGSEPQFVLASATIANPGRLAETLLGEPATVVEGDAAPRAERTIALWNPELIDAELGIRASALGDASRLLAGFTQRGLRTICFAKSRKAVELIHRFTVERVDSETARRLAPYRAGYTPSQRREIEGRLMAGELLGRHRDRRARARDRHRRARRRDLRRLPRHRLVAAAAVGARRAARARDGRARRERGRPRPVLHARPRISALPHGRGRDLRPHEPPGARRPRPLGRLRGPDRRARRGDARPGGARARAAAPGAEADGCRLDLGRHRLPRRARRAPLRRAGQLHGRRRARPAPCSGSSSAPAPTGRCTRARSTSTSASSTSCAPSTSSPAPPSSPPRRSTGTRRRRRRRRRRSSPPSGSSGGSASTSTGAASP